MCVCVLFQALEHSVDNLAQAINAIFEEDDDQDGPNFDIEEKLQVRIFELVMNLCICMHNTV